MSTVVGSLSVTLDVLVRGAQQAEGALAKLKTGALLLGASALVGGIIHFGEKITENAVHLNALAASMGMTTTQAQLFGYAAEASGSSLKELSVGVSMFERQSRAVANGTASKRIAANFAALGIDATKAKDALSGPDGLQRQLFGIADAAKRMGNTPMRSSVFTSVFGARSGRAALSDFAGGSERLKELFAKRASQGLLSDGDVKNLRDLNIEAKAVTGSFSAIASITLAKMAPGLIELARGAQKFIAENREVISGVVAGAFRGVAMALSAIGSALAIVLKPISWFSSLLTSAKNGSDLAAVALIGLASAIAVAVVPALVSLAIASAEFIAIWTVGAVAVLIPLLPIIAILAAIGVAVYLVAKHWDRVRSAAGAAWGVIKAIGAGLKGFFINIWHGIGDAFDWVISKLRNAPVIKQIIDAIQVARQLANLPEHAWNGIKNIAGGLTSRTASPTANATHPMFAGLGGATVGGGGGTTKNVNVGPTTVNIVGVQGAASVPGAMGRAGEEVARRHTAAALNVP